MEKTYLKGLFANKPHPNSPDFIKAKITIKREDLLEELKTQTGEWIKIDIKEGRDGKYYTQIDTWKPNSTVVASTEADEIPF